MADKGSAIVQITNKATGVTWEVTEGSPTFLRCAAQPNQYEIQGEKPTKKGKLDG